MRYIQYILSREGLFKTRLILLEVIPIFIIMFGLFLLYKYEKIGKYKDKFQKRIKLINLSNKNQKIFNDTVIKFKKNYKKIIPSLIISMIIYYILKDMGKIWYVKLEIIVIAILSPAVTYSIFSKNEKFRTTKLLPIFFQGMIDEVEKGLIYAIRNSTFKIYNEQFKNNIYDLASGLEENNKEILSDFYIRTNNNPFIYQFTSFLEKYLDNGGDIKTYLKNLKLNTIKYIRGKEVKRKALLVAKILAVLFILSIPLGIKFSIYSTMGYTAAYYQSPSGQDLIAFALLYSIIVLLCIYSLDNE